jgi:hypothetical protein
MNYEVFFACYILIMSSISFVYLLFGLRVSERVVDLFIPPDYCTKMEMIHSDLSEYRSSKLIMQLKILVLSHSLFLCLEGNNAPVPSLCILKMDLLFVLCVLIPDFSASCLFFQLYFPFIFVASLA